jgi:hypothetical protein
MLQHYQQRMCINFEKERGIYKSTEGEGMLYGTPGVAQHRWGWAP